MKLLVGSTLIVACLGTASAALAQSTSTSPNSAQLPNVQTNASPAAPVASSKLFACQTAARGLQGQDRQDQMQLCVAQARLDCLKQAIEQKVVGPQRREFIRTCVQQQ